MFTKAADEDRTLDIGIDEEQALGEVLMNLEADDYVKTMDAKKPPDGDQHVFLGLHPEQDTYIYIKLVERRAFVILSFKEYQD